MKTTDTHQGKCGDCAFTTDPSTNNERVEQQLAAHEIETGHRGIAH